MTKNEFITALKKHNYAYGYNEEQHMHQVFDENGYLVAMIDANVADIIMIYASLPQSFLDAVILHFGKTPIDARIDLKYVDGQISKQEFQDLKNIKLGSNMETVTLTTAQLHALRHIKKQVNQYFQDKYANEIFEAE